MFTKEHELVRKSVREFAEKELAPLAAEIDKTGVYPEELWAKMARYNFVSASIPKEYEGGGGGYTSAAIVIEELCRKCGSTGTRVGLNTSLAASHLVQYGTEEQKQKYLVPMAKGEKIGALGLTEPGAGSDAAAQQTTAVLEGDHYVLNGSKCFITCGPICDFVTVVAMTDKSKGVKGMSTFIVESNWDGFTVGKNEDKLGIKGTTTSDLIFKNVKVPKENLIGREGEGFKIIMQLLDTSRIAVAAQALGIAQGAMDEAVKYIKERKQFRKSLDKFQGIQWMIAEMETKVNAARGLVYDAAFKKDSGLPFGKASSMAKYYAGEIAFEVANKALQLHGGYGYIKEYSIERMLRDARITSIYEGTSEVQKMVIAGHVLK